MDVEEFSKMFPPHQAVPEQDPFEKIQQAEAVQAARQKQPEPPQSWTDFGLDVTGAGAAGVGRGFVSLPGIVGDVGQLYARSPAYSAWISKRIDEALGKEQAGAAQRAYEQATKIIESSMTPEERQGMEYWGMPTGQKMTRAVAQYVPSIEYQGKSPAARVVGTVGEFLGQVPVGGPTTGAIRAGLGAAQAPGKAAGMSREILSAIGAGGASGTVGEALSGSQDEAAGRIFASVPGALLGRAVAGRMPGAAAQRGENIAGDILRKTEPEILTRSPLSPTELVEGVQPTIGQTWGSRAAAIEKFSPEEVGKAKAANQKALERAVGELPTEIREGGTSVSTPPVGPGMADLSANPMAFSSEAAQKLYLALEQAAKKDYDTAWKHPAITQARYNKNAVSSTINAVSKKEGRRMESFPDSMRIGIEELMSWPTSQIPFEKVQMVKSQANTLIREAKDPAQRSAAISLSTALDDMMTDTNNVSKIFMKNVIPSEVGPAFDKARTATRTYKETFETPTTGMLSEKDVKTGFPLIQPENFLSKILQTPDQALAKYRELQRIPGLDISRPVSDWIVSKIQGGGIAITPEMVAKFRQSPSYDTLIREVPGLESRLNLISSTSRSEQVANSLTNQIQQEPSKLLAWLRKNKSELDRALPNQESWEFVRRLYQSADILKNFDRAKALPNAAQKQVDLLSKGDLFTLLHGRALGIGAGALGGYAAGKAIGLTLPAQIGMEAIGAGAGAIGTQATKPVVSAMARIVYGTTKEQAIKALQRAAIDPEFAKFLASKPSEANAMKLRGFLREITARSPVTAAEAGRTTSSPSEEIIPTEEAYKNIRPLTIRPGRAHGGKVGHEHLVNRLMKACVSAKKDEDGSTKPLLDAPDEHIVKALDVAQRAL